MRRLFLFALAAALAAGCGSSEPTGPKQTLNEQEKQQVRELDEQRKDEWGSTRPKGK